MENKQIEIFNKRFLNLSKLKPEEFFVFIAGLFGLSILLLTPPFQIPDEIIHFTRAYQISEGKLIPVRQNNRIGGTLPLSLIKITEPFLGLRWYNQVKTNRNIILEQFKIRLKENERKFIDFPNNALYPPVSYFPQSISIFVLRKLKLSPLYIFYGARLFTLLFWIFAIYHVIKTIPFYKWLFVLIALLPMSLFINMSLSADVMTNILSFTFVAFILRYAFAEQNFTSKNFIILSILTILLASAKLVYTPMVLLIFIIPKKKFKTLSQYYLYPILLFVIAFCTVFLWSIIVKDLYIPYNEYNKEFRDVASLMECVDAGAQMEYILSHGFYIAKVFIHSMIQSFDMYFRGYIGTFGWLDTMLPIWLVYMGYLVLFAIALIENNKTFNVSLKQKMILLLALILTIGSILLSQHLSWDCVGGEVIATIQGRYFIPVFPLLFIAFYNGRLNFTKFVIPVVILFTVISLLITVKTLYTRYYVHAEQAQQFTFKLRYVINNHVNNKTEKRKFCQVEVYNQNQNQYLK